MNNIVIEDEANKIARSMIFIDDKYVSTFFNKNIYKYKIISFNPKINPIITFIIDKTIWKFISINTSGIDCYNCNQNIIFIKKIQNESHNLYDGLIEINVSLDYCDQQFQTKNFPIINIEDVLIDPNYSNLFLENRYNHLNKKNIIFEDYDIIII